MNVYEKIKELAAQKHISIRQLEEKLGIANGTIRRWSNSNPSIEPITKVANYFHVSVDYLLGRDNKKPVVQKVDIGKLADEPEPDWDEWLSLGGKPLSDNDKETLKRLFGNRLTD